MADKPPTRAWGIDLDRPSSTLHRMETGSHPSEACASGAAVEADPSPVFDVIPVPPGAPQAPLVYASPHSGGQYPERMLEALRLDPSALRGSEDSLVDSLIAPAPAGGATVIHARVARAFVDLNREPWELDPAMFEDELPDFAIARSARVAAGLGAIASSEAESRAVAVVLAVAGVVTVVGLMAGTGSGDWVKALVAAVCWAIVGLTCGLAAEVGVNSGGPVGFGGAIGLGIGAWAGVWAGAGSRAIAQASILAGSKTVYGAWAAIGIMAGVVARMVAAERLIHTGSGLYTFTLLVATSGFGLWLGNWLVDRIF